MGLGIPPLKIKIVLESNPLKSTMLVGRLAEPDEIPANFWQSVLKHRKPTTKHNSAFPRTDASMLLSSRRFNICFQDSKEVYIQIPNIYVELWKRHLIERIVADGIGTPDPNPRNLLTWCF